MTNETDFFIKILMEKLDSIETRLDSIDAKLCQMSKETSSMQRHVNFVEEIYEQVKSPFHSAMTMIDRIQASFKYKNNHTIKN